MVLIGLSDLLDSFQCGQALPAGFAVLIPHMPFGFLVLYHLIALKDFIFQLLPCLGYFIQGDLAGVNLVK